MCPLLALSPPSHCVLIPEFRAVSTRPPRRVERIGFQLSRKQIHVTRTPDGDWRATKAGADRAVARRETQTDAEKAAKDYARGHGGFEVITHGRDGKIRSSDSVGSPDPIPPRDREH